MAFTPPYFFDYPPYFTLQPVQETRRKQSALWQDLILSYCRQNKVFTVSLTSDELPIFANHKIKRRLSAEAKRAFFDDLVATGRAAWIDRSQDRALVLWKKLDAWAATIHAWARQAGMEDSVMTLDELSSSDEVAGTELEGTPRELLLPAIRLLEKQGKARLFKAAANDDDGVKFFA